MKETIFDGMKEWTNEMSRNGLHNMLLSVLTGCQILDYTHETTINQLLTFMVRDLEKA